jgi:hypothetical protein
MAAGFFISFVGFLLLAALFGYGSVGGRLDPAEGIVEIIGTVIGGIIGWQKSSTQSK